MAARSRRPSFGTVVRALSAALGCASLLVCFAVTHLPAPTGVGTSEASLSRRIVRGVWHTAGDIAHGLGDRLGAHGLHTPALLDPLLSDKTIHFAIFLGPGFFWAVALGDRLRARSAGLLLAGLALWAAADEGSQHLLAREGELLDFVANVAGAAVGVASGWALWTAARRFLPIRDQR